MNILSLSALIKFGRIWDCRVLLLIRFFLYLPIPCHLVVCEFFFGKIKNIWMCVPVRVCDSRIESNWTLLDWVDQNSISQPYLRLDCVVAWPSPHLDRSVCHIIVIIILSSSMRFLLLLAYAIHSQISTAFYRYTTGECHIVADGKNHIRYPINVCLWIHLLTAAKNIFKNCNWNSNHRKRTIIEW